jgi:hypothetical protein
MSLAGGRNDISQTTGQVANTDIETSYVIQINSLWPVHLTSRTQLPGGFLGDVTLFLAWRRSEAASIALGMPMLDGGSCRASTNRVVVVAIK